MAGSRVPDAIRRFFNEAFAARDVAEALASFDASVSAVEVARFMNQRDFDVVGIRRDGSVMGFVERKALGDGSLDKHVRALDKATVIGEGAPILRVLMELARAAFVLVEAFGHVAGIITREDMQKPPVRMWLFGIVTMVETHFASLIEKHCPGESWKAHLTEGRLQKAQALLEERRRRNQALGLIDCLQFADKGRIIARHEKILQATVFPSRSQAEEATKRLEQLRNNLAHSQDILATDWNTIIQLCEFMAKQ